MSLKIHYKPVLKTISHQADTVLIAIISLAICIPLAANVCRNFKDTGFDAQNLYLWEYAASMNIIPFQDIFFPYGYLQYYRTNTPLAFVIYALITPIAITLLYTLYFKRLFKYRPTALVAWMCCLIIFFSTLGVHGLSRYGLLIISSLLTITAITRSLKQPRGLVLIGLINSLILLAATAEGLYSIALSFILINLHLLATHPPTRHLWASLLQNNSAYLIGLGIGAFPLILLNTLLDNWPGYFQSIKQLSYMSVYAKSDYIPTDRIQALILAGLVSSSYLLTFDFIKYKQRIKPAYWLLVALTFASLIAQQKNLMRSSTHATVSYVIVVLLGLVGYTTKKLTSPLVSVTTAVILIVLTLISMDIVGLSLPKDQLAKQIISWYQQPPSLNVQLCLIDEATPQTLKGFDRFQSTLEYLQEFYPGQPIFPFPYAPMLYVALNQKPAPYPNFYDASALDSQIANIKFMEATPVNLVIYDLNALIFDAAPESVRNNHTLKYILNHFEPVYQKNDQIILARVATPSAWLNDSSHYPTLVYRLTHINWGQVPRLEAIRHSPSLLPESKLVSSTQSASLNYPKNVKEAFIIAEYPKDTNTPGTLQASISGELTTTIEFPIIKGGRYLFHLQNIPQYMFPFQVARISMHPPPQNLSLYQNKTLDLW